MDRNDTVLMAIAIIVSSTLYFVLVFTAALVTSNLHAMYTDIAAVGVTYLFHTAQLQVPSSRAILPLFALTVILGATAGILLLV